MSKSETLLTFAKDHLELERLRVLRNRWVMAGLGGVAVFGASALATEGSWRGVSIVAAMGAMLGSETVVLDTQTAIDDKRESLDRQSRRIVKTDQNTSKINENERV